MNRHGRRLAHLNDHKGRWVQRDMLTQELARVGGFSGKRSRFADMLAAEDWAREANRGIWSHPLYAIKSAVNAQFPKYGFDLVEGTMRDVS